MARGLGEKGAGRRVSQRIYVEIEIYALEGGGGEELLAGGKEEAAHTRGTVAGGKLEHEFADIHQMHARHAGAVGTHKVVRAESGVQQAGIMGGGAFAHCLFAVAQEDVDEAHLGREAKGAALRELHAVHAFIVAAHHLVDDGQVGLARLQDYQALLASAAGAARHLRHHLKTALVGAEVGLREHLVGVEYAHHVDVVEVEALGHHLRADEDVGAAVLEIVDDALVSGARARGVEVHAPDAGFGEAGFCHGLYLLRAAAYVAQFRAAAGGADGGHGIRGAAVVAHEAVDILVERKRHVAPLATRRPAARMTFEHRCIAPAVLKEYHLLFRAERGAGLLEERGRERRLHQFLAAQFLHVGHGDGGEGHAGEAAAERDQSVLARFGVAVGLDGGRGSAEQHLGSGEACQHDGGIAGVVARRGVLLLVARFVLLVHNNQFEI